MLSKHSIYSCNCSLPAHSRSIALVKKTHRLQCASPVAPPKPQTNIAGCLGMAYGLIRCYFLLTGGEISAISAAKFRSRVALTP